MTPAGELREAARRLRNVAPLAPTGGPLAIVEPVADWLDLKAAEYDPSADIQETDRSHEIALTVARTVNGGEQP
jgi:hypothetical protein